VTARILLSAAHKSSGKTTVSLGLAAALRARGLRVQPFKKGPDYIDPMWLAAAAGRPCYNLDFNTQDAGDIRALFASRSADAELALIEGNKGLHDGTAQDGSNSNAGLARVLGAPVVLVLDTRGMTRGVAALVLGFQAFDPGVTLAGVILNQVGGSRHESKLREALAYHTGVPVLGAVPRHPDLEIRERHLGLMPSNEHALAGATIERIAGVVAEHLDLDAVLAVARAAPAPAPLAAGPHGARAAAPVPQRLRIGIARDAAFGFYYPDDLEAFADAGAELVPFDTLRDTHLPAVDGLFIGGGFPETQMAALEANAGLRAEIRAALEAGLPAYAECGGLMYLARRLRWGEEVREMVGVLPLDVVMEARPQGRGYARLMETGAGPWPPVAGGDGARVITAHEFHYSRLDAVPEGLICAYRVQRGSGIDGQRDGVVYRNLLASYVHLRNTGASRWVDRFVAFVRDRRARSCEPPAADRAGEPAARAGRA
jgi:cobyrinic acid a,c-diamide synthase